MILLLRMISLLVLATFVHADDRWNREIATVNTREGYAGPGADFKIDATGTVHACYSSTESTGDTATYVRWIPGGQQEIVKLSTKARRSFHAKIALSTTGDPVVAFADVEGIKIAKRSGGIWSIQTISSSGHYAFTDLSLAVDSSNRVHVLFNGYDSFTERVFLKYTHEDQGGWAADYFYPSGPGTGNHGEFHDIALSETDEPHIVFQACESYSAQATVKYAHRNSVGDFVVEHVADQNNLGDIEMCREVNGVIHVVHPGSNSYLSYSKRSVNGIWSDQELIDPRTQSKIQVGYTAISVERGILTIGYTKNYNLAVAVLEAGVWKFSELPNVVGGFGPILSQDHHGRICYLYSSYPKLWLNFSPSSYLPVMKIKPSGVGMIAIDFGGLTPDTNYVLKRSPDLVNWSKIQDFASEVGSYSYEEIKSGTSGYYRVELQD